ncbi:MAG: hypothetical protein CMB99_09555 [Flavobacteriaceae bacterium]|nr:hypothetical protein [Flavobacteriaceae bacterium]|tara:strand:+ start:423075 stop:423464 length:390 start_codon:yes stop_codon:yes gene_type:complete
MKNLTYLIVALTVVFMSSCVQEEHQKTITFSVDMRGVENPGNVGIRGDFTDQRWRETVAMTDEDGDSIYSVTLSQKTAIYGIEFKFVNQDDQFELKDQNNREIIFEYKPEVIEYMAKFNNNKDFKINRK